LGEPKEEGANGQFSGEKGWPIVTVQGLSVMSCAQNSLTDQDAVWDDDSVGSGNMY